MLPLGLVLLMIPAWTRADDATLRPNPAARLSRADEATEFWSLTARFSEGYRLFVRFGITNEGPGEQTAGAIWYLVRPDGRVSEFRNAHAQGLWKLSPDHLRLDVASSSLDLHAPVRRLAIDSTSQGAKIDLRFPAGDAPVPSAPLSAADFHAETLQVSDPVEGTIWVRGMAAPTSVRGTIALTHAWMDESITKLVQRYVEFVGATPDLTIHLLDVTTPAGDDHRRLLVERRGTIDYQTTDFELTLDSAEPWTRSRRYPVPGRLLIRDSRVNLDISLERLPLRTNPMEAVPEPFRLLFSFKIDPRWIWADASLRIRLADGGQGPPVEADGQGELAVSFLNPLPRPK